MTSDEFKPIPLGAQLTLHGPHVHHKICHTRPTVFLSLRLHTVLRFSGLFYSIFARNNTYLTPGLHCLLCGALTRNDSNFRSLNKMICTLHTDSTIEGFILKLNHEMTPHVHTYNSSEQPCTIRRPRIRTNVSSVTRKHRSLSLKTHMLSVIVPALRG